MIVGMRTIPIANVIVFREAMREIYAHEEERDSVMK